MSKFKADLIIINGSRFKEFPDLILATCIHEIAMDNHKRAKRRNLGRDVIFTLATERKRAKAHMEAMKEEAGLWSYDLQCKEHREKLKDLFRR